MTAQKILELIESVDPSDVAALDEIDARVWCFVNGHVFRGMSHLNHFIYSEECYYYYVPEDNGTTNYTRSRDALKAIRPEGWHYSNHHESSGGHEWNLFKPKDESWPQTRRVVLPTEELAELHTIISAIEYERTNNDK